VANGEWGPHMRAMLGCPGTWDVEHQRVRRLFVIAAVTLFVAAVGSGCGSKTTSPSPGATSSGAALQSTTPPGTKAVDQFVWDLPAGEPTSLDPVKAGDYSTCFVSSQLNDTLVRFSPDWKLGPGVAESWTQPDPLTLVYTIRQNARFWDGNPVTADDVVFSLKRNMDPKTGTIWMGFYDNVKSITKTGPWAVTVKFSRPDELFGKEMGDSAGGIVEKAYVMRVGEAKYGSGTNVMGSGPYKLVAWKSGSEIVLQANPGYWDPSVQPKVQKATLKFISDTSTVTSALLSGELDGAYEVPVTSIPALKAASNGKLYFGPSVSLTEVMFANSTGPLGNPQLRKALYLAIDRQAIVEKVFNGAGIPNKTLTPPSAWDPAAINIHKQAYNALPSAGPDVAAAKQLAAGQPGTNKPLVMAIQAGDEPSLEVGSIVQQAAKEIGLTVTIKQMQPMDFSNLFYVSSYRKGVDLVSTGGFLDLPDPLDYTQYFFGQGLFNWLNYRNAQVEQDLDLARHTYDPVKRANLIVEAQKIYTGDAMVIPLVQNDEVLFMNNRISGAPASFTYIYTPSLAMLGGTQ
jgi:peptide/nickel transport system substrate-binding protein